MTIMKEKFLLFCVFFDLILKEVRFWAGLHSCSAGALSLEALLLLELLEVRVSWLGEGERCF